MSEAKKVTIGVVSGVLGIAVLFALISMIVGKGDEPTPCPQPIVQQSKPVPPKPAPVQVQPQALLAEQPQTEPTAVSSAEHTTQLRNEGSATSLAQVPDSSTRSEPNPTPEEHPAALRGEPSPLRRHSLRHHRYRHPHLSRSQKVL